MFLQIEDMQILDNILEIECAPFQFQVSGIQNEVRRIDELEKSGSFSLFFIYVLVRINGSSRNLAKQLATLAIRLMVRNDPLAWRSRSRSEDTSSFPLGPPGSGSGALAGARPPGGAGTLHGGLATSSVSR